MSAHRGFIALVAALLTAFAVRGLGLTPSLEAAALVAATALAIGWTIAGLAWLGVLVTRRRLRPSDSLALAAGMVAMLTIATRVHFEVFRVPLDADTLRFAWQGLTAREVVLPVGTLACGMAAGALAIVAVALGLRRFAGDAKRPAGRLVPWLALASAVFVAAEPTLSAPHAEHTAALRDLLPWQEPLTERRVALAALALRDGSGEITRLRVADMEERFGALRQRTATLLANPPTPASKPSLLFIVMESFRADLVGPDATPFLASLGERCASPELHFATGPNTESGLFGLLNGLSMHYYWHFKQTFDQPLPLALLGRWGYRRSLYRSFGLEYTNLGPRFLEREIDHDRAARAEQAVAGDREIIDSLIEDLEDAPPASREPRLDLAVTYATHWGYHFPPEFLRYEPVAPEDLRVRNATSDSALREYADGLHNRQRNAAGYTDSLIREVFGALERTGRLDDTIIVVTGDHGEAFFEHGRLGHTWSLENEMIRVPLFVCTPDARPTAYRFSDHADVFPTIFDWMGVAAATRPVTTGKSLFDFDPGRDFALSAIPRRRASMRMAVIGSPYKVAFLPFGPLRPVSVTDLEDRTVVSPRREAVSSLLRAGLEARRL